jgi:cytoskeletal protein CcmA (bactofilin family)
MKYIKIIGIVSLITIFVAPSYAMILRSGQDVEVKENEVIDDDLIILGRHADIRGQVNGDILAFAQIISLSGKVDGTIIAGGQSITLDMTKVKSVWAGAAEIDVAGPIDKNLVAFGGSILLADNASIGRDLVAYGGEVDMRGKIDGRLKGSVGHLVIAGQCRSVDITAENVRLKSRSQISGDLVIRSEQEPTIEDGVKIGGETKLLKPETKPQRPISNLAPFIGLVITFIKIIMLISKIIVGLLIIALFRKYARHIMDTLITTPWKSLGWGFLGAIVIPVSVMILFAVLIGWPIAVLGIYAYSILLFLASIFVAMVIGEKVIRLFKKDDTISLYPSFIIGILILFVLGFIPVLNFFINICVFLFGAGMLILGTWRLIKEMKAKDLI